MKKGVNAMQECDSVQEEINGMLKAYYEDRLIWNKIATHQCP